MISCASLILATLTATAQEPAATSVRCITEANIFELTVKVEPLSKWLKPVLDKIDALRKKARDESPAAKSPALGGEAR